MLAEGDVRGQKVGDTNTDQITRFTKLLDAMKAFLNDVKYGKRIWESSLSIWKISWWEVLQTKFYKYYMVCILYPSGLFCIFKIF